MPNDPEASDDLAGAWFGEWISDLSGTIETAAVAGGQATQNAKAYLADLRSYTDPATPHLDMMLTAVLSAIGDLEELAEDVTAGAVDPEHRARVQTVRAAAVDNLDKLTELMRTARPSAKHRALFGPS